MEYTPAFLKQNYKVYYILFLLQIVHNISVDQEVILSGFFFFFFMNEEVQTFLANEAPYVT